MSRADTRIPFALTAAAIPIPFRLGDIVPQGATPMPLEEAWAIVVKDICPPAPASSTRLAADRPPRRQPRERALRAAGAR